MLYSLKLDNIDPQERIVMIFQPNQQPETKRHQDNLPVLSLLQNWQISVQDVFSYLTLN